MSPSGMDQFHRRRKTAMQKSGEGRKVTPPLTYPTTTVKQSLLLATHYGMRQKDTPAEVLQTPLLGHIPGRGAQAQGQCAALEDCCCLPGLISFFSANSQITFPRFATKRCNGLSWKRFGKPLSLLLFIAQLRPIVSISSS